MSLPVSVYSEFQKLEEMIVGRPYPPSAFEPIADAKQKAMLQQIMEETEEDCSRLCDLLTEHGVTVRRPEVIFDLYEKKNESVRQAMYAGPGWSVSYLTPPLWPRDLTLTLGNKILSVYSRSPSRWWESQNFHGIFMDYHRRGAEWISMPPPVLRKQATSYADYEDDAILFHAACFVRCGRDIFHTAPARLKSNAKGTQLGLEWVQRHAPPELRFHQADHGGHLDGKIAFIKPGVLMTWLPKDQLPAALRNWDIIPTGTRSPLPEEFHRLRRASPYKDFVEKWLTEWIGCVDETYFDVNMISLSEELVILNGENPELMRKLNRHGVECIPFNFRHRNFWDGGLHCITLDVRRSGGCEDYF